MSERRLYDVAGDWGTSRLRLFRIKDGVVVDRSEGPGIAASGEPPEQTLRHALARWRAEGEPTSIRLSGMVGSRNGWIDVPYVDCPAGMAAWRGGAAMLDLDGIPVTIMAGLATEAGGIADVMRGEETQIFGALALDPALGRGSRTIVLPGTHSKWVTVEDGAIAGFRTFPTGELFALLRDHSTLARAAFADGVAADETAGFAEGLARIRAGDQLLGSLFAARSMQLRLGRSRVWALGYLSGLIIGSEVAEAAASFATGEPLTLIGDPALLARYREALECHRIASRSLAGDDCALAGLVHREPLP